MKGFVRPLFLTALVWLAPCIFADSVPEDLIAKAKNGDAVAQFELGNAYEKQLPGLDDDNTLVGKKIAAEAIMWWRKAAEQGNVEAEYQLATCLSGGWGVQEKNAVEAANWYRKAAEQGDSYAAFDLGLAYEDGEGVPKDGPEAVKWFRKAADMGDPASKGTAEAMIGEIYEKGDCVPKDDSEATQWYRKAADHENALAQGKLGRAYLLGNGVPKDTEEAIKWFQKAAHNGDKKAQEELKKLTGETIKSAFDELREKAENGDAKAQFSLAVANANWKGATLVAWGVTIPQGERIPKDIAEAVKWLRKSADLGYPQAEYYLGRAYRDGFGLPKDQTEALKWYRNAANHGLPEAQDELGLMYDEGVIVPKDLAESVKWYRMAADNGDVRAQSKMGDLTFRRDDNNYLLPIPEERKAKAAEWFQKAADHFQKDAESGDIEAQYQYGKMLEKVAKAQIKNYSDTEETRYSTKYADAAFWFMKAAYKGHSGAQLSLAYHYLLGEGIEKNDVEGTAWEIIAAAGADEIFKDDEMDQLKRQELEIGPETMRLAEQRAKEISARIAESK